MSDRVRIDVTDGIAHVRMDRPDKVNALDGAMFAAIAEAGETVGADSSVRAVVLSGEGRGFCAGLDFGFPYCHGRDTKDPDFGKLANTPGARDWTMVDYDLDRAGNAVDARIVGGTRHDALDAASLEAVGKSRFAAGDREGCRYPYWLNPGLVEAPPMPPKGALEPANAIATRATGSAGRPN